MKKDNRIGLWIAGAVVLIAVIIGVIGLVLPRTGDTPPAATDDTTAPAAPVGDGACPTSLPPSTTSTVPTDLRWAASQGMTWPVSDTVGPTSTSGGFANCFQQSPIGAALLSATFYGSVATHSAMDSARFYAAPSAELDQYLRTASPSTSRRNVAEENQKAGIGVVGYRIDSYTADHAVVTLVLTVPNSSTGYRGLPFDLVWHDSDWKIGKLSSGSGGNVVIDVLDGQFTKWSA